MTSDELLEREDRAWLGFVDAFAAVPEARREDEGVVPGWSVKDLLWHCGYWTGYVADLFERAARGDDPPPDRDWEAFNAVIVEEGRAMTWDECIVRTEENRSRLRAAVPTVADTQRRRCSRTSRARPRTTTRSTRPRSAPSRQARRAAARRRAATTPGSSDVADDAQPELRRRPPVRGEDVERSGSPGPRCRGASVVMPRQPGHRAARGGSPRGRPGGARADARHPPRRASTPSSLDEHPEPPWVERPRRRRGRRRRRSDARDTIGHAASSPPGVLAARRRGSRASVSSIALHRHRRTRGRRAGR